MDTASPPSCYPHVLLFLLLSAHAAGLITGDLVGTVQTVGGAPLAGAEVTLIAARRSRHPPAAHTDAAGRFAFDDLPPGTYGVDISLDGYQTLRYRNQVVNIGHDTAVEVTLPPQQRRTPLCPRRATSPRRGAGWGPWSGRGAG